LQAASPAPVPRSAPPLFPQREQPVAVSHRADAPRAVEAKTSTTLKLECSKCGQRILVDESFAGTTGICPTCGGPVVVPAFAPPVQSAPRSRTPTGDSILGRARGFAYRFSGLQPLRDFKLSHLFTDVFKNRTKQDFDAFFNCGSPSTTPDPTTLGADLPRPWFYLRMLIFGGLVLFALCFGYEKYQEPEILPCLMIGAAFLVPLSCVALFFELNVPRNVSVYQVAKLIVGGAIVSLPVAWFIFAHTRADLLGTLSAELLEEIAQAVIAVVLLRGAFQYRWIMNGLLFGAAVSAGLAGLESARSFLYAFIDDLGRGDGKLTTFYSTLTNQLCYGCVPLCHVLWTGIITGALWRVKQDEAFGITLFFRKRFLRILVIVIALQALWNSGLLWTEIGKFSLVKIEKGLWVVSIIGTCYLALLMVQEGLRQVRAGPVFDGEAQPEPDRRAGDGAG
jgi:protease PrsW